MAVAITKKMKYAYRKSALENAKTYSLAENELVISEGNTKKFALPYTDISAIRLFYSPHRYRTHNYVCLVESKHGKFEIKSTSYVSFGEFSDKRYSYKRFVTAFVQEASSKSTNVKLFTGNTTSKYWFYMFITTVTVLGLAGLFAILPIPGGFGFIVGLLMVAYYLFYSLKMFAKNYPRQITNDIIPDKVLPK